MMFGEVTIVFDAQVQWILGQPCAALINEAKMLRLMGYEIPHKAEAEQAAVHFWMLELYCKHGESWRDEVVRQLEKWAASLEDR